VGSCHGGSIVTMSVGVGRAAALLTGRYQVAGVEEKIGFLG